MKFINSLAVCFIAKQNMNVPLQIQYVKEQQKLNPTILSIHVSCLIMLVFFFFLIIKKPSSYSFSSPISFLVPTKISYSHRLPFLDLHNLVPNSHLSGLHNT